MIQKTQAGKWLLDIQPGGRGKKRYRKTFDTKAEALRFQIKLNSKVQDDPFYALPIRQKKRLTEYVNDWYDRHGILLTSGPAIKKRLINAANQMQNPVVTGSLSDTFAVYRSARVSQGIKQSTINRELASFKSVFSTLIKCGLWGLQNPFQDLKNTRVQSVQLRSLSNEEIKILFEHLEKSKTDACLIALVCLSTGARWSEAQNLMYENIQPGLITFTNTKTKLVRSIPVNADLYNRLQSVLSVRRFAGGYFAYSYALMKSGIQLPEGQNTHVLRHTFASHYMQNGGNILTLQKILGHASLNMTLRYAHLAPDYLKDVLEKNPALTLG